MKHLKEYRSHRLAIEVLKRQGKTPESDSSYIHKNTNPLAITEQHVICLTWEESRKGPQL